MALTRVWGIDPFHREKSDLPVNSVHGKKESRFPAGLGSTLPDAVILEAAVNFGNESAAVLFGRFLDFKFQNDPVHEPVSLVHTDFHGLFPRAVGSVVEPEGNLPSRHGRDGLSHPGVGRFAGHVRYDFQIAEGLFAGVDHPNGSPLFIDFMGEKIGQSGIESREIQGLVRFRNTDSFISAPGNPVAKFVSSFLQVDRQQHSAPAVDVPTSGNPIH